MPKLSKGQIANFRTLSNANHNDRLCLIDCQDKSTGKSVAVVAALNIVGKEIEIIPLAKLFDGNPYDELLPPNPDGGYHQD